MNGMSSHGMALGVGSVFGCAVLGILTKSFGLDPAVATDWLIVGGTILGGPVLAWAAVKYKGDPAITAALQAFTQMQQTNGNGNGNGHPPAPPAAAPAPVAPPVVVPPAPIPLSPPAG